MLRRLLTIEHQTDSQALRFCSRRDGPPAEPAVPVGGSYLMLTRVHVSRALSPLLHGSQVLY